MLSPVISPYFCVHVFRFKLKYHPEDSVKKKQEHQEMLKVSCYQLIQYLYLTSKWRLIIQTPQCFILIQSILLLRD